MSATTLTDLQRQIVAMYAALGDVTQVQVGFRYVGQQSQGPRVVLAKADGEWGPVPKMSAGYVAGVSFGCNVHIWGVEPTLTGDEVTDELARFDGDPTQSADPLLIRFTNILCRLAPGRKGANTLRTVPGLATHGEAYVLRFDYTHGVPRDEAVWRLASTDIDVNPPDPDKPNGDTGSVYHVTTPVTPIERP